MTEPHYRHLQSMTVDGVLVLTITHPQLRSGDFDLIDRLRLELLEAVGHSGLHKVVVDLSRVDYIGSAGFRPLLSLRKRLQEVGGEMLLCSLCPEVREVFLTSRLINASGSSAAPFGVEADAPHAVARLNQGFNGE
ncbi:MAG TPA: STAS domain-containing protein [Gemmataceae bacterium]|nr:STAS domain-containing protein [Gemmataceae bacterium]